MAVLSGEKTTSSEYKNFFASFKDFFIVAPPAPFEQLSKGADIFRDLMNSPVFTILPVQTAAGEPAAHGPVYLMNDG